MTPYIRTFALTLLAALAIGVATPRTAHATTVNFEYEEPSTDSY